MTTAAQLAAVTPEDLALAAAALKLKRERQAALVPRFRGAAAEAQETTAREWILSGPAETGKTWAWCWRLDSLLRATPHANGVIARKVRKHMGTTVLRTFERIARIRGGVSVAGGAHPEWYQYPNAARLYVVGMDDPGKLLSGEFDFFGGNQLEEFSVADWETVTTRVTGRGAVTQTPMVFGDCNPGPPTHWILTRAKTAGLKLLHSLHVDNPTLYDEAGKLTEQGARSMAALDRLTGVRRDRLYLGKWVAAEGVVYEGFERRVHVVEPFDVPADWRAFLAIDFGFTNPFVAQLWRVDGDGRMYLTHELYRTQRLVEDHAADIRAMLGKAGVPSVEAIVADHDAEDRATLARRGFHTQPAFKAIEPGLQAVSARIRQAGDGRPRLFVFSNALQEPDAALLAAHRPTCTAEEFEFYVWPQGGDGKAVKEQPVKENDHGMDAMRYAVAYLDGISDGKYAGALQFIREENEAGRKAEAERARRRAEEPETQTIPLCDLYDDEEDEFA